MTFFREQGAAKVPMPSGMKHATAPLLLTRSLDSPVCLNAQFLSLDRMSISAAQRAALHSASRPPGPPALWYAVGTALRSFGATIDAFGASLQGESATDEKRTTRPGAKPSLRCPCGHPLC